ncbi:hypothetical protein [Halobacillus sp. BBL2006]|uniref:glycosyl-4,4'-diaponeurosporenoate acyltransferase CrtO family protein n=1 Tax=Halobacillus sp. BBL2006 TaxID=1543706 RepID=UPI0005432B7C|nr:hypothetical protein [Halobacillus sp. BBL2006]KHE68188.1 hypothetical protein LD39_15080 [Halobacillus sp. BBL2006]
MIIMNIVAWLFIHLSVSFLVSQCPESFIMSFPKVYRLKRWEKNGNIYERLKIKKWKHRLPEARKWVNQGKGKTGIYLRNVTDFHTFKMQTNRSELSHWLQMLPAPFFFLFNPPWAGWIMMLYAVLFNLPFIMVQRYNRARIEKLRAYL